MSKLIERLIRYWNIEKGYYNEEGMPLVCPFCDCGNITEHPTGFVDGSVRETCFKCSKCGKTVGYWCEGSYDPKYVNTFYWETLL